jgi:hypothetical protein
VGVAEGGGELVGQVGGRGDDAAPAAGQVGVQLDRPAEDVAYGSARGLREDDGGGEVDQAVRVGRGVGERVRRTLGHEGGLKAARRQHPDAARPPRDRPPRRRRLRIAGVRAQE